jgi:hypothetical protein
VWVNMKEGKMCEIISDEELFEAVLLHCDRTDEISFYLGEVAATTFYRRHKENPGSAVAKAEFERLMAGASN